MGQKFLSASTIKAISHRVSEELSKKAEALEKVVEENILASKEWKQHLKLAEERRELSLKLEKLEAEILRKHHTPILNIKVYYDSVKVSENHRYISSDRVRDMLLIEEYISGSGDCQTPEELIQRIVHKIMNG